MKIKRLEVPFYIEFDYKFNRIKSDSNLNPVFNKNGRYLMNGKCWIEYNGLVIEDNANDFMYDLAILNYTEMIDKKLMNNLHNLIYINRLKNKEIIELYKWLKISSELRDIYRISRKEAFVSLRNFLKSKGK